MTTNNEEEELYNKLVIFKKERDFLIKIYEEVDSVIRSGYDGPFMGEEIRGIFQSVIEYKNWKNNLISNKKLDECHAHGICAAGDPYDFPCATCPNLKGK